MNKANRTSQNQPLHISLVNQLNCGNESLESIGGFGIWSPFSEVKPTDGYKEHKNHITGKTLPYCCSYHQKVFERAKRWLKLFPNCCNRHKKMVPKLELERIDYSSYPEKVVKQISYTDHHCTQRITAPDWYEDITDYILYNVFSFGHPMIGLKIYLEETAFLVEKSTVIPKQKKQKLLEFINDLIDPQELIGEDIRALLNTFDKWLKLFPFNISFFKHLRPYYEKQLPVFYSDLRINQYTGRQNVKIYTKYGLEKELINLTNIIITEINTSVLEEKGLLTMPQNIRLELIKNKRKLKLKAGYINDSYTSERSYKSILDEWFNDELEFLNDIINIMGNTTSTPIEIEENLIIENCLQGKKLQTGHSEAANTNLDITVDIKPKLKPEIIHVIFDFLKDFFNEKHQPMLKRVLNSEEISQGPLLFLDNGNRLADLFKKLYEHDFIIGCEKKDLEKWIVENFKYYYRKEVKKFTSDYIEKCISRDFYPCKNPIIEIKNGEIIKTTHPRKKA